jgi:hypothetical protein
MLYWEQTIIVIVVHEEDIEEEFVRGSVARVVFGIVCLALVSIM